MESLNMNNLAKSLPPSNVVRAEKDLTEKFKAAALSITTLYRSSLATSKQHYNAGYAAALEDLLAVIQQGVSVGGGDGMTIGRIMDWIDARREVIKEREEEEDEEDERDSKSKRAPLATVAGSSSGVSNGNDVRDKGTEKDKSKSNVGQSNQRLPSTSLPTPRSPEIQAQGLSSSRPRVSPQRPSSPSPPPTKHQTRSRPRLQKQKDTGTHQTQVMPDPLGNTTPMSVHFNSNNNGLLPYTFPSALDGSSLLHSDPPIQSVIGAKRRHAVMLENQASPLSSIDLDFSMGALVSGGLVGAVNEGAVGNNASSTVPPRRRVRNQRSGVLTNLTHGNSRSESGSLDAMDVEDENGRERKRVARR